MDWADPRRELDIVTRIRYRTYYEDYLRGLSPFEIARVHDISETTVGEAIRVHRYEHGHVQRIEDLCELIDQANFHLRVCHEEVEALQQGIPEEVERIKTNGEIETTVTRRLVRWPGVELGYRREIRATHERLQNLKALLYEAIQAARDDGDDGLDGEGSAIERGLEALRRTHAIRAKHSEGGS